MTVAAAAVAQEARRVHGCGRGAALGTTPDPTRCSPGTTATAARLPWRAAPGERADPYRVWLSEIMLQQTTVKAVAPYYCDVPRALADRRSAGRGAARRRAARPGPGSAITPARATCTPAPARWSSGTAGDFPDTEEALRALPGIGAYTAAAIAAIAFDRRAVAVDGNIERVIARLFAVEDALPAAKAEIRAPRRDAGADAAAGRFRAGDDGSRRHDLHAEEAGLRALSRGSTPARRGARGDPETFPRKAPKVEGQLRRGASFVVDARRRPRAGAQPARRRACSAA